MDRRLIWRRTECGGSSHCLLRSENKGKRELIWACNSKDNCGAMSGITSGRSPGWSIGALSSASQCTSCSTFLSAISCTCVCVDEKKHLHNFLIFFFFLIVLDSLILKERNRKYFRPAVFSMQISHGFMKRPESFANFWKGRIFPYALQVVRLSFWFQIFTMAFWSF